MDEIQAQLSEYPVAARLGRDFIKQVELVEYEELGMGAVFTVTSESV
jgi:tartrate dehydratase beta subunit/fumarate hydratase class I family protein